MNKNMRAHKGILFGLTLIVMVLASRGISQVVVSPATEPQVWWLNVEASPLEVRFSPSRRDVELFNRSSGRVIQYRLGCVRVNGQRVKALHRLAIVGTDLGSNKSLINSTTVYMDSAHTCMQDKAKLAIVEVGFGDGSVWKVK
jgi:hypothetical protein